MQLCSKCGESCRSTLNICPTCTHFETFKVGQEVRPKNRNSYAADRRGVVCEVQPKGAMVRVYWAKQANGVAAKRTWMSAKSLIFVVRSGEDPFPEDGLEVEMQKAKKRGLASYLKVAFASEIPAPHEPENSAQ